MARASTMRSLDSSSPWARYADSIAISTCVPLAVFAIASAPNRRSARARTRLGLSPGAIAAHGETRSHVCSPEVQPTHSLSGAVSRKRPTYSKSSSGNVTQSRIAAVHVTVVPAAHDPVPSVDRTNVSPSIS